ncbi:helix-turn-helix domain-containing protein [Fibrisoma montanum]|uniref:Helix-turn-helix domain-containing protein n=1 Tax=Fibrisoma montanum TaxID=2305895 RepID=A0A418LZ67_9BACT|nr:helix-turn-helix domain-containing protein [Fibrisoma montanum]RIV18666.1 helix-turn-helix domain-containing protein [Fibrisoma montanum]
MKTLAIQLDDIIIKPITNDEQFQEASQLIDYLIDADLLEDVQERKRALDILEALTVLAIDYEKKHYAIPKPDPIEAIKQRMEQLNLSQRDVAAYFGGENRVSEVLNRRRSLTLKMIKALHQHLGIPTDTLLAV